MKRLLKFFIYFLIAVIIGVTVLKITGEYIVIDFSGTPKIEVQNLVLDDTIQPFLNFDFSKGKWKALVYIAADDIPALDSQMQHNRCLFTSDPEILNRMKETWRFRYNKGDMATVESRFYLFNNGKLVFKCGIVLDENEQGLQSRDYGWLKAPNREILNSIENFDKVQFPILFLYNGS